VTRFSDRIGVTKPQALQVDDMNDALRNSLWNFILSCMPSESSTWRRVVHIITTGFLKERVDKIPYSYGHARAWLRDFFDDMSWFEVYNLIEFVVERLPKISGFSRSQERMIMMLNLILQEEMSAYRFIDQKLVPISNPIEVTAIEMALDDATKAGLDGVQTHIQTALDLIGQKPTPDYRNSIKESISAVESAAKCIVGAEKGELKDALAAIETKIELHGALKKGFLSLYGYSSDASGIRHALLDEPTVDFDDAKFMLVSCSAFASFLISKGGSAGLVKT
jgi:AbiJ-like protein